MLIAVDGPPDRCTMNGNGVIRRAVPKKDRRRRVTARSAGWSDMNRLANTDSSVKGDRVPNDSIWPPSESALLAACESVFGDSIAISDDAEERAGSCIQAARVAIARAHEATPTAATDWATEARSELDAATVALDSIPPAEQGRVLRARVAGLRDDVAELRAVLAGER